MLYISTGEPLHADPLPDPFKFTGNEKLKRVRVSPRESGMVGTGALNRALGREDENNSDPVNVAAAKVLADIASSRGMPLTLDAEDVFGYPAALAATHPDLWRRRLGLAASFLAVVKAYRPNVERYCWGGTPLFSNPELAQRFPALADEEAALLAPLVSGPAVANYKAPWNDLDHWTAESDFYRTEGAKRYKGKPRLYVSPQEWKDGVQVGYVGDKAMDHFYAYALRYGMDFEIWGVANTTLGPQPQAWAWLKARLKSPLPDTVRGGSGMDEVAGKPARN